ncbi:hypothetical protein Hypma_014867 [Hypsizygus marmoreus]|uniref:Integrase catalytic domain-containing protein n=1 Tax=Hypsizygus marmoreus TaxID=39966 RepID=A0A369K7K2_HYPMA|nr:hypothetical protein Hypma_014867 [Hypsizygus marmoreus]
MTRWILYLSLFDFALNHVPAQSHQGPDGLSRRLRVPEDSDDEDAELFLDNFINSGEIVRSSSARVANSFSAIGIDFSRPQVLSSALLLSLLSEARRLPITPFGSYMTTSTVEDLAIFSSSPPSPHDPDISSCGPGFDPSVRDESPRNALLRRSLLRTTDTVSYTGSEFEARKVRFSKTYICRLGNENVSLDFTLYRRAYLSGLKEGHPRPVQEQPEDLWGHLGDMDERLDNRKDYEHVPPDVHLTCLTHAFGLKDEDSPELWLEIYDYLSKDLLPARCTDLAERKKFIRKTTSFFVHDQRLWFQRKGKLPRLVVTDLKRRSELIAQAHNEAGHHGRDATYKTLADRFYWPNLYDAVAWFVRSCNVCQLRSRARPVVAFSPTWNSAILREFDLDTIHMGSGMYGKHYVISAIEPASGWPEARAVAKNDSETWARFIYEEIVCRYGCIPIVRCDGGPEFKGAAEILLKRYNIAIVIAAPYHPQANGVSERSHQTLVNSIHRACGRDSNKWPLYIHAALFAMRCTTSRVTGYTPYYILYGRHPYFAFDIADRTWDTLDWDLVKDTVSLLAICIKQILRRDKKLSLALEQQKQVRQRAVDDFHRKHERYLSSGDFPLGTWVLVHETWLDAQKGNKGALRWTGPYIVHEKLLPTTYRLRELDGVVRRESYAADRLKVFYFRPEHQTIRTVSPAAYRIFNAASTSTYAHAADLLSGLNQHPSTAAPPFPMSVLPGHVVKCLNPDLYYFPPVLSPLPEGPTVLMSSIRGHARLALEFDFNRSYNRIPYTLCPTLNIDDLHEWAQEYLPLR